MKRDKPCRPSWLSEDMTFCANGWNWCKNENCFRHPCHIQHPELPHSYAKLFNTEDCPLREKVKDESNGEG